ncbi:Nse1 non-SMC component of SMC5-6 complex-domain-containing protein [Phycomyces nitens]|nr:Nse1 non-SMC component of SMC5-6 complex-domain-containing protein [Phycomyces nitens]
MTEIQPVDPSIYNDCHRLFLQSMLTQKIVPEDQALILYDAASKLTGVPRIDFSEFVACINQGINEIDLALKRSHNERDGNPVIALVNTLDDEISQLATDYSPGTIMYFRQLVEKIMTADDEDYAINSMEAIRLGQKMTPPLTQRDTQDLLDRLVADGWLYCTRQGAYIMETRTVLELNGYLKEQYGDSMKECQFCLDVVTMGEHCEAVQCPVRIHRHCAERYFREQPNRTCPQCGTMWSHLNVFGLGLL